MNSLPQNTIVLIISYRYGKSNDVYIFFIYQNEFGFLQAKKRRINPFIEELSAILLTRRSEGGMILLPAAGIFRPAPREGEKAYVII